jgi:hypothetical protein
MVFLDCGDLIAEETYTTSAHWCEWQSIHVMRIIGMWVLPIPAFQFGDFI